jgi:hypothetical protein
LSEFCLFLLCLLIIDESLYEGATQFSIEAASLKMHDKKLVNEATRNNPKEASSKSVRK